MGTAGLEFSSSLQGTPVAAREYHAADAEPSGVRFMSRLPRFGHSSDFSQLASSDPAEQADYVVGLLAVGFFLLSVFLFWAATLVTLKCMGKRRVGLCAGRAHVNSDAKGQFKPPTYLWKLRCFFVALGAILILLCLALVGPGMGSWAPTAASTRKLNRDVKDLATQGLLIMDSIKRVRWNVETLDVEAILNVQEACPNVKDNTFVSNKVLRQAIQNMDREFDELKAYLEQNDLEGMRRHIDFVMDGTEHIETAVTVVERNDWTVRMFALVLTVIVFFMMLAAAMSGRCKFPALTCMSELFMLPVFIGAIVIAWLVTSGLAFASIANADFCTGNTQQSGPAGMVMDLLEERQIPEDSIIYTAFSYYQSECTTQDPIEHLYQYEDDLQSGIGSANEFLTKVEEIGIDEINERCGADVSPTIEGIALIKDNLGILLSALRSTFDLLGCKRMRPIYVQAFEGTACTDSSGSLTLLFGIMFGTSLVGMIMITLRSAMYPYKRVYVSSPLDEEEQDEWDEYQAYLRHMAGFVNIFGGREDAVCTKADTSETTSASTKSTGRSMFAARGALDRTSTMNTDDNAPDEETPLSPTAPDVGESFRSRYECDVYEDEERMPLSPEYRSDWNDDFREQPEQSMLFTPEAKQPGADDTFDEECAPLTPQSPIHGKRFNTPDFLSPGTFRRWRRNDDKSLTHDEELPETPLMSSPREQHDREHFWDTNVVSPLRRGDDSVEAKME